MTFYFDFIEHFYEHQHAVLDNFLSEEHYQTLSALSIHLYQQKYFQTAHIGRVHQRRRNLQIRRDTICWIVGETAQQPSVTLFLEALNQLLRSFNKRLFLGLWEMESHFAHYQAGSFYRRHRDQFQGQTNRKVSCVYYLNKSWDKEDGGALMLYKNDGSVLAEILPNGNRLVCFPSFLEHEVLQTRRERLSIAAWMKSRSSVIHYSNSELLEV